MDHSFDFFYYFCVWSFSNEADDLAGDLSEVAWLVKWIITGSASVVVLGKMEISLVVAIEIKRGKNEETEPNFV